jgi:hypothetical protein
MHHDIAILYQLNVCYNISCQPKDFLKGMKKKAVGSLDTE